MSKKAKHHIIPEVFLKKFTDQSGQIYRLQIDNPRRTSRKPFYPGGIGYEKDYYEIRNTVNNIFPASDDPLYVENVVNQSVETKLNKYWSLLEEDRQFISKEEKENLSEIIIHIRLRNQNIRKKVFDKEGIKRLREHFRNNVKQLDYEEESFNPLRGMMSYDQLIDSFARTFLIQENGADIHNQFLANNHKNISEHQAYLVGKHLQSRWIILESQHNNPFILGDNPGAVKNAKGYQALTGPFEFIFPINSFRYLYMINDGNRLSIENLEKLEHVSVNADLVHMYNEQSVWDSNKYIYGSDICVLEKSREQFYKNKET